MAAATAPAASPNHYRLSPDENSSPASSSTSRFRSHNLLGNTSRSVGNNSLAPSSASVAVSAPSTPSLALPGTDIDEAEALASPRLYQHRVPSPRPIMTGQGGDQQDLTALNGEDFVNVTCGGCGLVINEDSADAGVIHFATQLWHIDCFRCAKCRERVSTDRDDILLLSDGHPICGQCNYSCQICGLPILEEAIMTGDESYHASCFTCRSCNNRIEELVFAKTSQGIYCMPCHNERVARSRRHADHRRRARNKDASSSSRRKKDTTLTEAAPATTAPAEISSLMPSASPSTLRNDTQPGLQPASISLSAQTQQTAFATPSPSPSVSISEGADQTRNNSTQDNSPLAPPPLPPPIEKGSLPNRAVSPSHSAGLSPHPPQQTRTGAPSTTPTLRELRRGVNGSWNNGSSSSIARPGTAESQHSRSSPLPRVSSGGGSTQSLSQPGEATSQSSRELETGGRNTPLRSFDVDARESKLASVEPMSSLTTSDSALNRTNRPLEAVEAGIGLGISKDTGASSASGLAMEAAISNNASALDSPRRRPKEMSASRNNNPLEESSRRNAPIPVSPEIESDGEQSVTKVQVKRASRLPVIDAPIGSSSPERPSGETHRASSSRLSPLPTAGTTERSGLQRSVSSSLPTSYSFYDPEFMNLMESFGHFDSSDGIQLSSPIVDSFERDKSTTSAAAAETLLPTPRSKELLPGAVTKRSFEGSSRDDQLPMSSSISTIRARVRESLKSAQDGQVSMDTTFIETIIQELEDTKSQMKLIQHKYDRIKRASHQAAQGFSNARSEFEQQVEAREHAELEMLKLKRQLADQASKLMRITKAEKHQETLDRRSKDVKESLEGMTKDLARLTVERDMTVAEVAELTAMQAGRELLPLSDKNGNSGTATNSAAGKEDTSKSLQSRLSVRLDGVKAKYRKEIAELTDRRNQLLLEIEDLRQSRDVYLDETEALNARNEELNVLLSKLQGKVDSYTVSEFNHPGAYRGAGPPVYSPGHGQSNPAVPSKGGWFASRSKQQQQQQHAQISHRHQPNSSVSSFREGQLSYSQLGNGSTGPPSLAEPEQTVVSGFRGGLNLPPQAAAQARAEANSTVAGLSQSSAAAKKFKWMKSGAKSAGQGIASALPLVHSPPVPPKSAAAAALASGSSLTVGSASLTGIGGSLSGVAGASAAATGAASAAGVAGGNGSLQANEVVVREHLFQPFNVLRPTRCFACQKNMWGQSEVRCALCAQVCHSKCLPSLSISCNQPYFGRHDELGTNCGGEPSVPTVFGRALTEQVSSEERSSQVPLIVEKCIQAVEANGMDFEGIYRKSGGSSQLKVITQLFEHGQPFDLGDLDRFNDVGAITSVLKNYFRELPEPLLTYELHEAFIEATELDKEAGSGDAGDTAAAITAAAAVKKFERMSLLISQLPSAHRETLKMLCRHLKRVQARQSENRMTARNLGVVFGPTLMRSRDPSKEFSDMGQKSITIEWLCDHSDVVFAD